MVGDLVDDAFRTVAPKTLQRELDEAEPEE
jgi:hypothetical protein